MPKFREIKIETVLKMEARELQQYLHKRLAGEGRDVVFDPEFVYSPGTVPVLLVAHLDTVHKNPPTICKSEDGEVIMAPEGIGGDDRAGVYAVMKVLEEHDCHVLFTQGEEIGGIGARAFVQSGIIPEVNFIIEPDRKGKDDAVFYDCGNDDFIAFIEKTTGYKEAWGSFSDISIIAPALNRAAVNLSVGYYSQHTLYEYILMSQVRETIEAMKAIITADGANQIYDFKEVHYNYRSGNVYTGGKSKWSYAWSDYDDYYSVSGYATTTYPKSTGTAIPLPSATTKAAGTTTSKGAQPKYEEKKDIPFTGNDRYPDEEEIPTVGDAYTFEDLIRDETEAFIYNIIGITPPKEMLDDVTLGVVIALEDWGFNRGW